MKISKKKTGKISMYEKIGFFSFEIIFFCKWDSFFSKIKKSSIHLNEFIHLKI